MNKITKILTKQDLEDAIKAIQESGETENVDAGMALAGLGYKVMVSDYVSKDTILIGTGRKVGISQFNKE